MVELYLQIPTKYVHGLKYTNISIVITNKENGLQKYLLDEFTMFGEMPIINIRFYKIKSTDSTKHFSSTLIHDVIEILKRGEKVNSSLDSISVQHTLKRHIHYIKTKRVLYRWNNTSMV